MKITGTHIAIFVILTYFGLQSTLVEANDQLRPDDNRFGDVRIQENVYQGTVVSVYSVKIKKDEEGYSLYGGLLGGYLARESMKGKGESEEVLGTLAGGLVGSKIGREVNKSRNTVDGIQLIIDVPGVGVKSIIQQKTSAFNFSSGDSVYLVGTRNNLRVLKKNP
jgi:outer membrane lipoprotein SlyB